MEYTIKALRYRLKYLITNYLLQNELKIINNSNKDCDGDYLNIQINTSSYSQNTNRKPYTNIILVMEEFNSVYDYGLIWNSNINPVDTMEWDFSRKYYNEFSLVYDCIQLLLNQSYDNLLVKSIIEFELFKEIIDQYPQLRKQTSPISTKMYSTQNDWIEYNFVYNQISTRINNQFQYYDFSLSKIDEFLVLYNLKSSLKDNYEHFIDNIYTKLQEKNLNYTVSKIGSSIILEINKIDEISETKKYSIHLLDHAILICQRHYLKDLYITSYNNDNIQKVYDFIT